MRSASALLLAAALGLGPFSGCDASDEDYGGAMMAPSSAGAAYQEQSQPDRVESSGDKYEYVGTNPFVVVGHDPLSTFAVDVDTASYDIFRRDVGTYGDLPQRDSVRLEEWVNYFPYAYAPPAWDAEHPFSVSFEAAPSPFNETTLLRVGIRGKDAPEQEPKPANLVYLVDVSGSMASAAKLPLVKKLLAESLEVLLPGSRVAIVTYAGSVGTHLPSTSTNNKGAILGAIDTLASGGSTNGAGGIHGAYAQAQAGFIEGGINHVVLCTDGDFNVGVSNTGGLVDLIEDKRKTGVTLTVLGFGAGNLNDAMMEAVSNAGNGVYGVIANADQAIDYVHDRLLSALTFIAKDVKIQVAFNPEHVYAYRLLGYENRAIADQDFTNDLVDAGEIGSGHTVTALYELVLPGAAIPQAAEAPEVDDGDVAAPLEAPLDAAALCEVRLRYKQVDATEQDPATQLVHRLDPEYLTGHFEDASGDFAWAAAIAAFSEILKQSPYADPSDLDAIGAVFTEHAGSDADRLELVGLFAQARAMLGL